MEKKNRVFLLATLLLAVIGLSGCVKKYTIIIPTNNLWFGLEASSQTFEIKANCDWTIAKNDDAEWYTISQMEGKNDATITITVEALGDADFRGASFVIKSPGGHVRRTVFVSQNKLDFNGLMNKVFGVSSVEHWNTDYYGMMIEDSYKHKEYDPYDTATGYSCMIVEQIIGGTVAVGHVLEGSRSYHPVTQRDRSYLAWCENLGFHKQVVLPNEGNKTLRFFRIKFVNKLYLVGIINPMSSGGQIGKSPPSEHCSRP